MRVGPRLGIAGIEQHGGIGRDLGQRAGVGGENRRAAGHRLEQRQAEALAEGRDHYRVGAGVERRQDVVVDAAEAGDERLGAVAGDGVVQRGGAPAGRAGEHEALREPAAAPEPGAGVDQQRQILARLERADVQEVRLVDAAGAPRRAGARRPALAARNAASTPSGTTRIIARATPASASRSLARRLRVGDHEARLARRAPRRGATLRRSAGVPSSGRRSNVRSCTVSTTGVRRARGTA